MKKVVKRNKSVVDYDEDKIRLAIKQANSEVPIKHRITNTEIEEVVEFINSLDDEKLNVEEIQDRIEQKLMELGKFRLAKQYITYRYKHELIRKSNTTDETIRELLDGKSEYWNTENSNKNARVVTTQRDYIAGVCSTDISRRLLLPEDVVKAHDKGIIHFHDIDYYAQKSLHNCCLINLDDMLQNGTNINGVMIEKPHRLLTATTIATQIITAVASSQYGGTSVNLHDLSPFVKESYDKYLKIHLDRGCIHSQAMQYAKEDLQREIKSAVQTFNYQINSMSTTNGQAPFLTVFMYLNGNIKYKDETAMLIEEFLNQRILGMKNDKGVYITPAFPKLIYVLEEDNIHEDSKYWYLTELSAKCSAKRLVPDYISEKVMKELKVNSDGSHSCYSVMGCRSALTPDRFSDKLGNIAKAKNYVEGQPKFNGRFNQGVVTLSLPDVAFSSKGDINKFWKLMDKRTELCHKALQCRHERLEQVTSDVAPILWQYGALARLDKGEKLTNLLHNGYSTISLGYAGLYECVKYMTGKSHTTDEGEEFGLQVMQYLNDKCAKWKAEENIDYSIYGTPIESTTYKFAKCLKKRFGSDIFVQLDGQDRDYITNSYHVPVFEEINPFEKLEKEAKFQKLSPGGAISYIECSNLTHNPEAVLEVIKFIYDHIMYAELNTKSDYCQKCGYSGEILLDDNLEWYCPNCNNRDHNLLNVARRTCGYIGSNFWNRGRTQEIKERYVHLDNKDLEE